MFQCMYLYMYLCIYTSIGVSIYVSMYPCIHVRINVSMYVCTYLGMYVCIYVCMFVCTAKFTIGNYTKYSAHHRLGRHMTNIAYHEIFNTSRNETHIEETLRTVRSISWDTTVVERCSSDFNDISTRRKLVFIWSCLIK